MSLAYIPDTCIDHLDWAFNTGKHTHAEEYYVNMTYVVGVTPLHASKNDFQRYFKCKDVIKPYCNDKGLTFPNTCSIPPCNSCTNGNKLIQ